MTPKSETISLPSCECDDCFPHHHHDKNNQGGRVNEELLVLRTPSSNRSIVEGENNNIVEDPIVFVNDVTNLDRIHEKNVQLAVWQRLTLPGFMKALSNPTLAPQTLPTFEQIVTPDNVSEALRSHFLCNENDPTDDDNDTNRLLPLALDENEVLELIEELICLVKVFSRISDSEDVSLKLEKVGDNRCQYWHQDCVPLRLVTTYRGPCTEWIPPIFAEKALQHRKEDCSHALSLSHCDVALFQGRGENSEADPLDDDTERGIVHRSPRIQGHGIHRLILVLDIPQKGWHY